MEYKPRPDEFFITDKRTGKKVLVKRKNETVDADRRSTYQRQQDQTRAKQVYRQYEEDKKQEEGMKNLQGFLTFVSPSTYIGPVFNNNGKSYAENVMSGEGIGDVAGNVAIDMLIPFAIGGAGRAATNVAKRFPYRLNIPVSSDKYYRVVGMDAIDDANKSGLIRWQSTSNNTLQDNNLSGKSLLDKLDVGSRSGGVPYFTKGKLYMPPESGQAVIIGNNSIPWRRIGPKGKVNKYSPEDPINKGNSATPYINGQFNIAPSGNFEYWVRGSNPITKHLFKRKQFKSPVQLDLDFRYPLTEGDNKVQKAFASLIMRGKMPGTYGMRVTPLETVNPEVSRIMNNQVFSRLGEIPPENLYSDIYQGSRSLMQNYHPRVQGVNFPGERIVIKEGIYQPYVLPHELRHRIDDTIPLSSAQQQVLNKAYSDDFNSDEIKKAVGYDSSYDMQKEAITTNLDSRIKALESYDDGYAYTLTTPSEQNKVIDELSDVWIIDAIRRSNGYGEAYIDYLKRNNLLTKDKIQAFRNAMKYVGGVSAPIIIGTSTQR